MSRLSLGMWEGHACGESPLLQARGGRMAEPEAQSGTSGNSVRGSLCDYSHSTVLHKVIHLAANQYHG